MNLRVAFVIAILLITLTAPAAYSSRKSDTPDFAFDSIPATAWIPVDDSMLSGHGAVMLFEKVTVDDFVKTDYSTMLTTYCRVRIASTQGRSAADITIPYYFRDQKVKFVRGRTIRHNGDTVNLAPEQVIEREAVKAQGLKIKQTSFSMPGVSDDCIIEYAYKLQLPQPYSLWLLQKDLPLLKAELHWILAAAGGDKMFLDFGFFGINWTPNYAILNMSRKVQVQRLPSLKEVKEFVFIADSVPAFEEESWSLPDRALKGQVRMYYGTASTPTAFWSEEAPYIAGRVSRYVGKSKNIKAQAKLIDSTKSTSEKIAIAYDWVKSRFINVSYLKEDDPVLKKAKYQTIDESFKSGYCERQGINFIFCDLLREMNIDAKIIWVRDRDEDLFVPEAKYWQFDRTLVAVQDTGAWSFYCPGDIYLSAGQLPWYNEGISGLLGTTDSDPLLVVPFSASSKNRTTRLVQVSLNADMELTGSVGERRTGQSARALRVLVHDVSEAERGNTVKTEVAKLITQAEIDSVTIENVDSVNLPIKLKYQVKYPSLSSGFVAGRLLVKPFELMQTTEDPFVAQTRQNTIVMEYAAETDEALSIELPDGWKVEGLPTDTIYSNSFGSCGVRFTSFEHSVEVQRTFKINLPFAPVEEYVAAQKLYQTLVGLNSLTVALVQEQK
ncbi:MAG: DUF3857 domain-containing protein [Candidatus Zixiibacteriota bacterium]